MSDTPQDFSPELRVAQETLQPFDVREHEGLNPMFKLILVALGLLLAAFIVLKLYTPGVRDRSDPPRITADNTPFKIKPSEVGGTQTPNQDKVVFEVMDGKPLKKDVTPDALPEKPIKVLAPKPVVKAPAPTPVTVAPRVEPKPAPRIEPKVNSRPVTSDPAIAVRGSDWVVQVSSTRSQADASNAWTTLKGKYPALVSGRYADVKRADLGDKGIYYRTRVAGLPDKAAAQSLCNSFKAAGQACFVAKR